MSGDRYYFDPKVAAAYDAEQAEREITRDDVPFYVGLAKEAAAKGEGVLELACGTGRVTQAIADAGVRVVGIDNAPAMLEIARAKSGGAANPRYVEADMTSFDLGERFGLIMIPFRSFLLLLTVEEQKACLRRVHEHLVEGGRLALNFFNPSALAIAEWQTHKGGTQERMPSQSLNQWSSREYSLAEQTLAETRTEETLSDSNAVISRVYRNLRLRYIYRYEMEHLLALSGFEVEALYGWFDGRPFIDESDEMVWIARSISALEQ